MVKAKLAKRKRHHQIDCSGFHITSGVLKRICSREFADCGDSLSWSASSIGSDEPRGEVGNGSLFPSEKGSCLACGGAKHEACVTASHVEASVISSLEVLRCRHGGGGRGDASASQLVFLPACCPHITKKSVPQKRYIGQGTNGLAS